MRPIRSTRALRLIAAAACAAALAAGCSSMSGGSSHPMSFFITSSNPGQGGNLGGLAGADAQCQRLADAVGAGGLGCIQLVRSQSAEGEHRNRQGVHLLCKSLPAQCCPPRVAEGRLDCTEQGIVELESGRFLQFCARVAGATNPFKFRS